MINTNRRGHSRPAALLLFSLFFIATPSGAENNGSIFSCWDGTFAYTTVGVMASPDSVHVRIASQDETIFEPVMSVRGLDWRQAILDIWFEADACDIDGSANALSCRRSTPIAAAFEFGALSNEERQSLNPQFGEMRVELIPLATSGPETGQVTERILIVGQLNRSHTDAMVVDFSQSHDCNGWPDPFSLD